MSTDSLPPLLDDSPDDDGDVTRQLPAAERTVRDLAELAGADPEGTGEIELSDILEVNDATRTTKIAAIAAVVLTPRPEPTRIPQPAPRPRLQQPSSLAPIALDVPQRPSFPSSSEWSTLPGRESTVELAAAAGIPSRASRTVVFSGAVLGACIVAASIGAMLGYSHTPSATAQAGQAAPTMHTTPRSAVVTAAHEEITEPAVLAAGKDPNATGTFGDFPGPVALPDPPVAAATAPPVAAAPPPQAQVVTTPTPIAAPSFTPPAPIRSVAPRPVMSSAAPSTGILRVGSVAGVLIDGAPHRVNGGVIVVACGHHSVKAPGHAARSVTVPCGGATTL